MIYTSGHKYRTLLQPIYAESHKVRRVYVGDNQVYPDRLYAREPVMLRVTIKPFKLDYEVGEIMDYTGGVFDLLYRDNTICLRLNKDQVTLVPAEGNTVGPLSANNGKIKVLVNYYWTPDAEETATMNNDYPDQTETHVNRGRRY